MGELLVFTIIAAGMVVLIGLFIIWLTNKVGHTAVTSHFKDAEFILEYHHAPSGWNKMKDKAALLQKLDDLITFFETTPLVQDPDAKQMLLKQLTAERTAWEEKSRAEILG